MYESFKENKTRLVMILECPVNIPDNVFVTLYNYTIYMVCVDTVKNFKEKRTVWRKPGLKQWKQERGRSILNRTRWCEQVTFLFSLKPKILTKI